MPEKILAMREAVGQLLDGAITEEELRVWLACRIIELNDDDVTELAKILWGSLPKRPD